MLFLLLLVTMGLKRGYRTITAGSSKISMLRGLDVGCFATFLFSSQRCVAFMDDHVFQPIQ